MGEPPYIQQLVSDEYGWLNTVVEFKKSHRDKHESWHLYLNEKLMGKFESVIGLEHYLKNIE